MREDDTSTSAPEADAEGAQPQLPQIAEETPAPVKRVRRRSTAASGSPAPADPPVEIAETQSAAAGSDGESDTQQPEPPAEPEKPKRRAPRRRATAPAAAPVVEEQASDEQSAPEPQLNAPSDDVAADDAASVDEPVQEPSTDMEAAEASQQVTPVQSNEEAAQADPVDDRGSTDEADEQSDGTDQQADETQQQTDEVQPFVTSLAPQLSHVDAGHVEIEVSAPASFNPFALFQAPEEVVRPAPKRAPRHDDVTDDRHDDGDQSDDAVDSADQSEQQDSDDDDSGSRRRRRGRRGRGRRTGDDADGTDTADADGSDDTEQAPQQSDEKPDSSSTSEATVSADAETSADQGDSGDDESSSSTRRRRRRRRRGSDTDETTNGSSSSSSAPSSDSSVDKVRGVSGSVRLEAKRQRRREGRDHGRRRAPILTEAEFLARREAVARKMVVRQQGERTQIAVLEDDVLVEHYVTLASEQSFAGGVYYGRVQNVLPSMEAAFVDIGKRRNAVLYAGEVNWDAAGLEGKQRNIEQALKSGDKVLVQVTKDPIGHKGARLTSQVSLPGRYLVYVPGGSMTGISRKLPEGERQRLKEILRRIVPDGAGVIIRTAAEGATEEELSRDVQRLKAQWEVIEQKAADTKTKAPSVLYEEPDLAIRVVRDLFNEDFEQMVISGEDAWETISRYIQHVAPDLAERVTQAEPQQDVFTDYRIDEQLAKALERKVWLPSGGSLVIDRTEAMTVIDVNTGKFTGSGGNLEQTVTKNNLEAAEEVVRQLRLRDIGGIVVIDFIDMLLESNRELVLRRLTECLGRDRTKHQVAEVTSLGLVQMTRKRVGQGLLDAFSEDCAHCDGRGIVVHNEPIETKTAPTGQESGSRRNGRSRRAASRETPAQAQAEPRRDSTSQLSVIAAATVKTEDGSQPDPADQDSQTRQEDPSEKSGAAQPQQSASKRSSGTRRARSRKPAQVESAGGQQDAEPQQATETQVGSASAAEGGSEPAGARPVARRRRAARRPAGPPAASTT